LRLAAVAALVIAALALEWLEPQAETTGEAAIRRALRTGARIQLAGGVTQNRAEIELPSGVSDLEIHGDASGSTVRASDHFRGRAVFVCERSNNVRFTNFAIDGNRDDLEQRSGLRGFSTPFARFTPGNGILAIGMASLTISNVRFTNMPGFRF